MSKLYKVCCCCLNAAIKKDDSPLQIKRKKVFALVNVASVITTLFGMPYLLSSGFYYEVLSASLSLMISICSLIYLCVLKYQATDRYVQVISFFFCIVIAMGDFGSSLSAAAAPTWPLFVLITDVLLLAETPPKTSAAAVIFCCTWLIIRASEGIFRFGLFDLSWGVQDQATRRDEVCGCETLPCSVALTQGVAGLASEMLVFVLDFLCTRGFALSVLEEKRRILASIDTANHIAKSLSRFDLEMASELLDEAVIPDELKLSFELILANLKSYRPYLPQSCFPEAEPEVEQSQRSASCGVSETSGTFISSMESRPTNLRKHFSEISVSLLVANVRNSLVVLQHSQKSFMDLISDLVSTSFTIICQNRGTLDLFLGDRIFANFGATRVHSGHALSCVEAAKGIAKSSEGILIPYQVEGGTLLSMDIGMGSGRLHCGDLGSDTMIRYSFIGKLAHLVSVVERAACKMNITMLCEVGLYRQVRESIEICVHLQTILHLDTIHLLYEVIAGIHEEEAFPEEWMYQLESRGVGKWDAFNKVASALLMGEKVSDIGNVAAETDSRIEQLQIIMRDGVSTPLVVTSR